MRKQDSIRRARAGIKTGALSLCATLALTLAACGGDHNQCHYMSLGSGVIGQATFGGNAANAGTVIGATTLSSPVGGWVQNAAGTVAYVADTANNRILGFTLPLPAGLPTAAFVLGQTSFATNVANAGPFTDSAGSSSFGLAGPSKVSISDDNRLVVTDTGNNRILIWNTLPTSNVAPSVVLGQGTQNDAGQTGGIYGSASNLGAVSPTNASLSNPTGAMLGNNQLVVVDQNNNRALIWKASIATLASGAAASVELGQIDNGTGNGFTTNSPGYYNTNSTFGPTAVQFTNPSDVWTNGRILFISDTGNNRVLYWSQVPVVSFTNATSVIGQPSGFTTTNPGLSSQTLNNPVGVASNNGGQLFIGDTGNNRVLIYANNYTSTQRGITAIGVYGQQDFTHGSYNDDDQNGQPGDQTNSQSNTNATQNTVHNPQGVFIDSTGANLFVSDSGNNRIIAFPVNPLIDGTDTDGNGLVPNCNNYYPIDPDQNSNNN